MNAYDRALRLLAMREHSVKEIESKLSTKGYGKEEIDEAISRLVRENSLSDSRFACAFIRSRMRKNPEGIPILRMRLREKGIASEIADAALSDFQESGEYLSFLKDFARDLMMKKGDDDAKKLLLRKGFRSSEIKSAMSEE